MKSEGAWAHYESGEPLAEALAERIAADLSAAAKRFGVATLMVSGGSTPRRLFETLSRKQIPWQKVRVGLVDERWVEPADADSNERLVREHLLRNRAAKARFVGMYFEDFSVIEAQQLCSERIGSELSPFDVVVLGMGSDAHTASLFPENPALGTALDPANVAFCIAVQPENAPHPRMSLTLSAILSASNIYLHIEGEEKREVLENALAAKDSFKAPVYAVMERARNLKVYYAKERA